jgi:hypothetical protein
MDAWLAVGNYQLTLRDGNTTGRATDDVNGRATTAVRTNIYDTHQTPYQRIIER